MKLTIEVSKLGFHIEDEDGNFVDGEHNGERTDTHLVSSKYGYSSSPIEDAMVNALSEFEIFEP